jgi:hypothetical protein
MPTRPGENEADSSGKVAGSDYKTITSKWSKSAVPKTITDGIQWHTDFGMACGTVFNPLKQQILG